MTTHSTAELFQQIRSHVLAFQPRGGAATLATELGERFYYVQGPLPDAGARYPFVVGRLINQQITAQGTRLRADLELMLFDRPRARQLAAEALADRLVAALVGYRAGSVAGRSFVMTNPPQRDSLEPIPAPGDRELVQIRVTAEVIAYPQYLAQYAVPNS